MNHAQNLPVNRPADYVSPFITYTEAIGRLVVAGVDVAWSRQAGNNHQIVDKATDEVIGFCYRDGSSWKIKAEHVDDHIERFKREQPEFKSRKPFQHGEALYRSSPSTPGMIPAVDPVTFYRYLTAGDRVIYTGPADCIVMDGAGNQVLCDSNLLDRA